MSGKYGVILPYEGDDLDEFCSWARQVRYTRIERAAKPATVELYDGDWVFRGEAVNRLEGSQLGQKMNQIGSITLDLPIQHSPVTPYAGDDLDDFCLWAREMEPHRRTYLAHWAIDQDARDTSNIHVIVEKDGIRVGGFSDPEKAVTLDESAKGDKVTIEFLDDIAELKHVHMAANPFLPVSLIQQPKVQFLYIPVDVGGLMTLGMNVLRNQATNFNMDFELTDPSTWTEGLWDQAQIVPMPKLLGETTAPATIITGQIKQPWLDIMQPILEDAEMMIKPRRFKTGDPEPFPGAGTGWRNGTLFVDIVDKSGFRTGTSLGGNLATGLARTIANVTSNYVEDTYDLLTGEPVDVEGYKLPGILGTQPERPHAVYMHGRVSGVENFKLIQAPGGPCRITAGGQSMPGVNPLLEAVIGYAGDVLGDNLVINGYGVGSLGNILNAFLMPILKDSILANMSVPLIGRAAQQGWGRRLETAATGVTQAYTPAAIMDLRKRRRETDPDTAFMFDVVNAMPYLIGDNGQGHWGLGDRVGATSKYLGAKVFVARCRELSLPLGTAKPQSFKAKFGDTRTQQDAIDKMVALVSTAMGAFQEIGLG
ncbi:hypothetical protein [Gordonia sp. AC31]|uniref:Gp37-like protein n=1 Tax=Gordonia sp. AC31 TaxID=2962571 RepID=UPI002880D2FA|nr:hypothetical protein [Gordonia sp. AC31]MDT0223461.1 hypothetical protein [Gordonia sp. AC31]